jgi:hypothetical protein
MAYVCLNVADVCQHALTGPQALPLQQPACMGGLHGLWHKEEISVEKLVHIVTFSLHWTRNVIGKAPRT